MTYQTSSLEPFQVINQKGTKEYFSVAVGQNIMHPISFFPIFDQRAVFIHRNFPTEKNLFVMGSIPHIHSRTLEIITDDFSQYKALDATPFRDLAGNRIAIPHIETQIGLWKAILLGNFEGYDIREVGFRELNGYV